MVKDWTFNIEFKCCIGEITNFTGAAKQWAVIFKIQQVDPDTS